MAKWGFMVITKSKNTKPMSHSIPDFLNGCTLLRTGRSTTLVQTAHSVLKFANNPNNKKAQLSYKNTTVKTLLAKTLLALHTIHVIIEKHKKGGL